MLLFIPFHWKHYHDTAKTILLNGSNILIYDFNVKDNFRNLVPFWILRKSLRGQIVVEELGFEIF